MLKLTGQAGIEGELQQSNTLRGNPVDPILIEAVISDKIKTSI
jgi:hypothetical protein